MVPEYLILDKLGEEIAVYIRRSNKAKRVNINIKRNLSQHAKVELVLPNNDMEKGYVFLLKKEFWIRRKLANLSKPITIDPNLIPMFDKSYSLRKVNSQAYKVEVNEDIIQIYSPLNNSDILLREFLKNILSKEVQKIVANISKRYDLNFTQIRIITSKNKWGSCSNKGVLSFNWRLVFTPQKILNYVIIHEMCHLLEMNHSKKFWSLVENLCSDYKLHKLWLRENSLRLHLILNSRVAEKSDNPTDCK